MEQRNIFYTRPHISYTEKYPFGIEMCCRSLNNAFGTIKLTVEDVRGTFRSNHKSNVNHSKCIFKEEKQRNSLCNFHNLNPYSQVLFVKANTL